MNEDSIKTGQPSRRWLFDQEWQVGFWLESYDDRAAIVFEHRYIGAVLRVHLPEPDPKLLLAIVGDAWKQDMAMYQVLSEAAPSMRRRQRRRGRPNKPLAMRPR